MDFSWLDISKVERDTVSPKWRNYVLIFSLLTIVIIFVLSTLWLPYRIRLYVFIFTVFFSIFVYIRNFPIGLLFGILLLTIINPYIIVLDRKLDSLTIFIYLMSFMFFARLAITGKSVWVKSPLNGYIIVYWAAIFLGIINSIFVTGNVPLNAFHEPYVYIVMPMIFFIIISTVKNINDFYFILVVIIIFAFAESLYGIYQFSFSIGAIQGGKFGGVTRVPAHFGNPNVLAGWLEIVLPVVVAFILTSKKKKEFIVLLITAIIGYLVLLLTFSRGGFLTGFGALGLIMIFKIRNKIVSAVIITVFVLAIILGSGFLIRQLTVFSYEEMESDTSTLRRIVQYANYWWMMEKYPVLGIGWGARLMYHDYGTFERSHQPGFAYGHLNSSFFDFGVHNGFIGIFAFYSLIIAIIYNFWKNSRTIDHKRLAMFSWCLALGMLSFMAHSFLDGFYKSSTFSCHFWLLVGLGFAARIVWDRYGDKIDNADRFRFQIVNPFQKYLRKP